jgi:hypothetical protein
VQSATTQPYHRPLYPESILTRGSREQYECPSVNNGYTCLCVKQAHLYSGIVLVPATVYAPRKHRICIVKGHRMAATDSTVVDTVPMGELDLLLFTLDCLRDVLPPDDLRTQHAQNLDRIEELLQGMFVESEAERRRKAELLAFVNELAVYVPTA